MLQSGTRLGPYEIVAQLGAGGMGEVYRARDVRLGREVAIKVLPPAVASDQTALARFRRETKAIASISHPNILAIHDVGNEAGIHFAVTELLEGETLRTRITSAPLSWRAAAEIGAAIADGLSSAHAKGIVHRDLKPENIFLTGDGRVKILDFGLAQNVGPLSGDADAETRVQTRPGSILGTLGYMAPEQLRGESTDTAADIFSFGCLLYEMVTGMRAFHRPTAVETLSAILVSDPDIGQLSPVVPPEIEQVVLRCLAKERERRFPSSRDLAATLRSILSGSGSDPALAGAAMPALARSRRRKKAIDSLAVLPFVNATADMNSDYLSDGITETMIHSLAQLPRLRVMASSTVFRYKGQDIDPISIGRRLNVRAVLTGRMTGAGDRLVITTELVDVLDGSHVWGEQYRCRVSEIAGLQQQIAEDVCGKLRIRVTSGARKKMTSQVSTDSEAYQLYLKGRHQWNKRTTRAIRRGIEFCEEAIARDPGFAQAWAGIADCYVTLATNVPLRPDDTMPRARAAALKALELSPGLPEAHVSLASVRWWYEWDRAAAEKEVRAAIRLNPNHGGARDVYSMILSGTGDYEGAIEQIERAREADPLSLIAGVHAGLPLLFSGRVSRAIEKFHQTLDLEPEFIPALGWLGLALEKQGKLHEAIAVFERALESSEIPILRASMAHAWAVSGEQEKAQEILRSLEEKLATQYISPFDFAVIHAGLEEPDEAFAWLENAFVDRSAWMVFLRVDHRLDPLRGDPRFDDLVRRMGL